MLAKFQVSVVSKTPYNIIDGQQFCIWCYQLSWDGSGIPQGLSAKVGLVFPGKLDIKDPSSYPDVMEIQDTHINKQPGDDKQYIYKGPPQASAHDLQFFFIAPCGEDSFTPVLLVTSKSEVGPWKSLPFRIDASSEPGPIQTMRGPAVVGMATTQQPAQPTTAGNLGGASRRIPKCTYVPLIIPLAVDHTSTENGGAIAKFRLVGGLSLKPGEVNAAAKILTASKGRSAPRRSVLKTLRSFEGSPIPSQLPSPTAFGNIPTSALRAFGRAVVDLRKQRLDQLKQQDRGVAGPSPEYTMALQDYNNAVVGVNVFENNVTVAPIGMLNLERIEMTPVGIQRGELIATIPLAPLEQTAVVHKEWSVTSKEFTSIVTDSLENYSETGVTENTELAQATTSQTSHSNQFNINATVQGGYGPVTATVASAFATQDQDSASATESRKHAISTTRKASARVKQEHKVTISTTTVTGTSETSTRVLQNPSPTNPIRIDYFSIMRRWHVGLYRYGLRLTYDIAIPEPGATMRKIYAQIDELKKKLGPFVFDLNFTNINRVNWPQLAAQYQMIFAEPPDDTLGKAFIDSYTVQGNTSGAEVRVLSLDLPDGYVVSSATLYAQQSSGGTQGGVQHAKILINRVADNDLSSDASHGTTTGPLKFLSGPFQASPPTGLSGKQYVEYLISESNSGTVEVDVQLKLTDAAFEAWQQQAWNALYNAAQTQYYATQQDIQAQIAALEDKVSNVDTLTLRREENEEIMKGVLRWLLGPNFDFMPADVVQLFKSQHTDVTHGTTAGSGDGLAVTAQTWSPLFMYGEMVKFINEAIEWENVLYFVYSYFWDVPPSWDFIRQIKHPDVTREAFLRAGSARVVLTVRKGWEVDWVSFVETGSQFGESLIPNHPYMPIAQEIQAYDQTNYPGIPPANPGGGPLPDSGESVATVSSDTFPTSAGAALPTGPVTIKVKSSDGFIVGYTAILDSYDSGEQETQAITGVPDATHITVEGIGKPHDGSKKPFAVMQAGEKGQLIAEWFEYTPTSGTDIAVTSNLATIA